MEIDILSLFPKYFISPFDQSIIKRAILKGLVRINNHDIRDYSSDKKHRKVDDRPFGGGPGMVLSPEPICKGIRNLKKENSYVVYLSPQGKLFNSDIAKRLSKKKHLILLSGHYEGIDQRIIDSEIDEEISIGDYVLTNGCVAAICVIDATIRYLPGVLGNLDTADKDTFAKGIFKGPQYTRPEVFENKKVPDILLSGDHSKIEKYRMEEGIKKTKKVRPDLYEKYIKLQKNIKD